MDVTVVLFKTFESLINFNFSKKNKYLILATENSKIDLDELNKKDIEYYGAIFPKLIFKDKIIEDGYLVFLLKNNSQIEFIENMNLHNFNNSNISDFNSFITIVDGFSEYNVTFLENLFEYTNINTNIIGGGAGSFDKNIKKYLFSNTGFYEDSSIIVKINNSIDICVSSGWEVLAGPFVVTASNGKRLEELDYENAFEIYKKVIEKDRNIDFDMNDFMNIVKDYPLGIVRLNKDYILRDPLNLNNNNIELAGDIEKSSVINILKAKKSDLLDSTFKISNDVLKNGAKHLMIFECASRLEYLSSNYINQLEKIENNEKIKSLFGVISIGEIANCGDNYINFLNKSCVMGGICH